MEGYIPHDDPRFPARLLTVTPPIKGLWVRGAYELVEHRPIVAIVGSRKMSRYGKQVLADIVPKLVSSGHITVSGFMYGIDIEMHRLTMESNGQTIGVLGWGIDYPVIPENDTLYHKLLDSNSLFLSEVEPKEAGALWTFPRRNRIVVGLADIVIVVEAGRKSGSLNSAEWGRKLGKQVYAVPGNIFSTVSEGCNWLLTEGFAKPLTLDFFEGVNYSIKSRNNQSKVKHTASESTLVTLLTLEGPQSVNELSRKLDRPVGEISALLTKLLLTSDVDEERGIWHVSL